MLNAKLSRFGHDQINSEFLMSKPSEFGFDRINTEYLLNDQTRQKHSYNIKRESPRHRCAAHRSIGHQWDKWTPNLMEKPSGVRSVEDKLMKYTTTISPIAITFTFHDRPLFYASGNDSPEAPVREISL